MGSAAESPYEQLADRRFAFYPALRGVEHNEWALVEETWSEILAKNVETGAEYWIPRAHLGDVSSTDEPVLIVGLKRELEIKAGEVRPVRNRVVSLPGRPEPRKPAVEQPEPVAPVRGDSAAESSTLVLVGRAVAIGLGCLLLIVLLATGNIPNPVAALFQEDVSTVDQRYLGLSNQDSSFDVFAKLGQPESERWLSREEADLHFQLLEYPARRYRVVMMGPSRGDMKYIGTLHAEVDRILDSARLSGGGDTRSMLRNLPGLDDE